MGDTGLLQFPITDGIDQRTAAVVGQFRAQRFERVRYLQPGEAVVSPGYAYLPGTITPTGRRLRCVGWHRNFGSFAVYSGLLSTGYFGSCIAKRGYDGAWLLDETSRVSPVEAPRRMPIDINQDSTTAIPPQVMTTSRPSMVVVSTSERVSIIDNGVVVKSYRFPFISSSSGHFLQAAGRTMFDQYGSIWTYDIVTDTWTRRVDRSIFSDPVTSVSAAHTFGVNGSSGYGASVHSTGKILVFHWDGSNFSLVLTIPATDLTTSISNVFDISVAISGSLLVRVAVNASAVPSRLGLRVYDLAALASSAEYFYAPSDLSPARNASLAFDANGGLWCAFNETDNDIKASYVNVAKVSFTSGGITGFVSATKIDGGTAFTGMMFGAPASGVFVVTGGGTGSTCLWLVDDLGSSGNPQWPTSSATLCTWWGFGEGFTRRAQVCCIATRNEFDGTQTQTLVIPYFTNLLSVSSGNEIVTVRLGLSQSSTPVIPCSGAAPPSSAIAPLDVCQIAGDIVSGGYPFALGNRIDSAGVGFQVPPPVLRIPSGPTADAGSMSDGTYQYLMVLETLDSLGNVIRSMPSSPESITLSSGTALQAVHIYFSERAPQLPGVDSSTSRWVIYRTTANGSVFYNSSQGSYKSNYTEIGYTDRLADTDLISRNILYSQGQSGAVSGQKPNYAIPPCRSLWSGRDRYIAGGLEKPRRVRWSKLFVDGERTQFPHPSEAEWSTDMDDDIMAVAQLDEAWIIWCRQSAFAVYGPGPEDNGGGGEFETPRCISRIIGCHSQRSVCEIPEGLLFQGQDGIIYLMMRGTLQIVSWSEKVRNLLVNIATGQIYGWVSAVVLHETRGTIHFVRNSDTPLVYNTVTSSWSEDSDFVSDGLVGAISATDARITLASPTPDHFTDSFPTVYIATESGKILYEGCNDGTDMSNGPVGTVAWTPLLETNDMALWGLMGWGTTPRISFMLGHGYNSEAEYPVTGKAFLTVWDSDTAQHDPTAASLVASFTPTFSSSVDYRTLSTKLTHPKSGSRRIRIEWGNEKLVGVTLEGERLIGSEKNIDEERA